MSRLFGPWAFPLFFPLRLLLRCSEICSCWIRTLISTSYPSVRVGECIGCLRRSSPQRLCILGMSRREAFPSLGALVVVTTGSAKTCSISFFCEWVCETGWNFNVALVFSYPHFVVFSSINSVVPIGSNVLSPLELVRSHPSKPPSIWQRPPVLNERNTTL